MPRRSKRRTRLTILEAELHDRLKHSLPDVANGRKPLFFFTSDFNPLALPVSQLSLTCEQLRLMATEVVSLRSELGLDVSGCPAARLIQMVGAPEAGPPMVPAQRVAQEILEVMAASEAR